MSIKHLIIRVFPLFFCYHLHAEVNDDIYFYHLGARDGLSQVNIMSIYQDELGVMWFGSTEGLNRYNGNEMQVFKPDQAGTGLSRNIIYEICGNKKGAMYLRNENDLVRYDIHQQRFECIRKGGVSAIAYNHDTLWVALRSRIVRLDQQSGQLEEYVSLNDRAFNITSLCQAEDNTLWVGTSGGLCAVSANDPGVQTWVVSDVYVNDIYQDSSGCLWVGTYQDGVYQIDLSGQITNHRYKYGENSISNDQVRKFKEDNSGRIWIATFYGLDMYNPQTKLWKKYINHDQKSHSLSHSSVFSLYKDGQGTMWVGTYFGGVNYFNPEADIFRYYESKSAIPDHLSFPYVGKMTEDKYGNLWVCTEGGALNCLNLETRQFSRFALGKSVPEKETGYNQKAVWYRADKDLLYVGIHNGGLAVFDVKTKSVRVLTRNDAQHALPNNTINKMQYYNGFLYLMTQSGLVKMALDSEQFYFVKDDPEVRDVFPSDLNVSSFHIDRNDWLWVSTTAGIAMINLKTGKKKVFVHDPENEKSIGHFPMHDVFESSKGELFFMTNGAGIFKYNPETSDFNRYTEEKNGLLSNYCYDIAEAPSGKLILLHNKGFAFFNPENVNEDLFRSSSGFPIIGFNQGNTAYICRSNEIFIGGINGLVSFMESDLDKINREYALFFDKLFVNNRKVLPGDKDGILKKTLPLCSGIELKYDQNNITIEFATSNYLQTMTHNFEYKLEGFDKDWIATESKTISYTNLNAGNYQLLVRETARQLAGNEKMCTLDLVIKPPLYQTKLAFLIYGLLIVLLVVGLFRFYMWRTKLETTLEFERKDKERIEELNRFKLKFFTNVSHEFRTPLTLITGQVETLMMQEDIGSKVRNKLAKIHRNTGHLLNLISELLDFRKQEQGFYTLNIKHVELVAYLREIYKSFEDHAEKKQIKYKFDCFEEEIFVYIDAVHFRKAVYNLISNAFKYTSSGGEITLKIRLKGMEVLIQIIDNGIGIPADARNKLFDRFYRLEQHSSEYPLGIGIGLALAKEIVTSHKGEISVESVLHKGSVFSIVLKLGTSHFSEEELNNKEIVVEALPYEPEPVNEDFVATENEPANDAEKPVVLIVDDNEALLEMLVEPFSVYCNVYTATNGREGLEMVYNIHPDLVISDVMMPEISGKELCYRMKNNPVTSHIPVVLLTAQASDSQMIDGYMFGADDYIIKPFSVRVLIARCNNLVKNRQLLYRKYNNPEEDVTPLKAMADQDQSLIDKTVKIIKDNFNNPEFDMNKLSVELGMGRSKLYTKIKEITGFTPNELTLNLKLKEAAGMLDNKPYMNISEVAFGLGFSSSKYFTKCFKAFYGMTPLEWKKRKSQPSS